MALQILSNFDESILRAFLGSIKRFQLVPYAILTKTAKSRFYIFRHDSTYENAFSFRLVRFCLFLSNDFLFFYWQLFKSVLRVYIYILIIGGNNFNFFNFFDKVLYIIQKMLYTRLVPDTVHTKKKNLKKVKKRFDMVKRTW